MGGAIKLRSYLERLFNSFLRPCGYEIVARALLLDWQRTTQYRRSHKETKLPEGAEDYLHENHPRLKELRERYSTCDRKVTEPLLWTPDHLKAHEIKYFRGDNPFVWQLRGKNMGILGYALTAYYVKAIDHLGLLEKLKEDEQFGIHTFMIAHKIISRDLLDSIIEIYFLEKHLNLTNWKEIRILDVGAGYGRLAHRMVSAFPNINTYFCTDAIAASTFISEYYLRFRKVDQRTKVIPLYDIGDTLRNNKVDLAINVESFSECNISAIDWWLSLFEKSKIDYLMIVPNPLDHGGAHLRTNDHRDFSSVIENHGYKLFAKEPKYRDPTVQDYGILPTYHYLFKLS